MVFRGWLPAFLLILLLASAACGVKAPPLAPDSGEPAATPSPSPSPRPSE